MTLFTESPWTLVTIGVLVEIVLLVVLVRTGRGTLLWAIAAIALLTAALVTIERWVVTDRESISQSLHELAVTLATNDIQAVLNYIAPSATEVRQLATTGMPQVTIKSAKIADGLWVEVNSKANPPSAVAKFMGRFDIKSTPKVPYETIIRRFRLGLTKENGRWLISTVEDSDLRKP